MGARRVKACPQAGLRGPEEPFDLGGGCHLRSLAFRELARTATRRKPKNVDNRQLG